MMGTYLLTDSGPLQIDACGFVADLMNLIIPGFCFPISSPVLLEMPTEGQLEAWQKRLAGMAPELQSNMARCDAGYVNQTLQLFQELAGTTCDLQLDGQLCVGVVNHVLGEGLFEVHELWMHWLQSKLCFMEHYLMVTLRQNGSQFKNILTKHHGTISWIHW